MKLQYFLVTSLFLGVAIARLFRPFIDRQKKQVAEEVAQQIVKRLPEEAFVGRRPLGTSFSPDDMTQTADHVDKWIRSRTSR